jgi:N-acetylmuramoyl-L-alanine amidase
VARTSRSSRFAPALLLLPALLASAPALAQRTRVDIVTDTSGANPRIVLTHSESVVHVLQEQGDRLEIVYAEPVRIDPPTLRVENPVLLRYELQDGDTLVFHTGPGYRGYESFELQNPFRLIIDLHGAAEPAAPPPAAPAAHEGKTIVVIDPGHGGIETGATGPSNVQEKDITLDLARRLRRLLQRDPGLHVVLTRDEDRLVGLDERTAIANHNRADLFISIHLNASKRGNASGAETYFLSNEATDDAARTAAALENRSSGVREAQIHTDDGRRHDLELVLWDLAQNQYIAESSRLAERVQQHMNELTGTRDRGVRQAPFRVLMGATMPAILVEVGFVSNPDEETKLREPDYRNRVVEALDKAIHDYLRDLARLSAPGDRAGVGTSTP